MNKFNFIVDENSEFERLDVFLCENLPDFSRSKIKQLILKGSVKLNGELSKVSKVLKVNDEIELELPPLENCKILAEDIDFEIIYDDLDFMIVSKPQGLIVHPTPTIKTGTLVNGLLKKATNLSGINGVLRPGIVHRIDKDTSGLMVVAKNDFSHKSLSKQIQDKTCFRIYHALNEGVIKEDSGHIETYYGRSTRDRKQMAVLSFGEKKAITDFRVIKRFNEYTYTEFKLQTGRTHQIRVHSKFIGHGIVGDKTYGYSKQKFNLNGQLLHAFSLELNHPSTGERMKFECPLPEYFENILKKLN